MGRGPDDREADADIVDSGGDDEQRARPSLGAEAPKGSDELVWADERLLGTGAIAGGARVSSS